MAKQKTHKSKEEKPEKKLAVHKSEEEAKPKEEKSLAVVTPIAPTPAKKNLGRRIITVETTALAIILILVALNWSGLAHSLNTKPTTITAPIKSAPPKAKPASVPQFQDTYYTSAQVLNPAPNFFSDYTYFGVDCDGITPEPPDNPTNCPDILTFGSFKYYKIGVTNSGQPIIVAFAQDGANFSGYTFYIALQTGPNSYSILAKPSRISDFSEAQLNSFSQALAPNVSIDNQTNLPDLAMPASFTINGAAFNLSWTPTDGEDPGSPMLGNLALMRWERPTQAYPTKVIGTSGPYSVYQLTEQSGSGFVVNEVYLTVKTQYAANYELSSEAQFYPEQYTPSSAPPAISWTDGTKNEDNYFNTPVGCGSNNGYLVATGLNPSQLTVIGKAPDSSPLYELPTNSPLFQKLYTTDYAGGSATDDKRYENLSADQFQADHAMFLYKDSLGELVVYLDTRFFIDGGCAKPVIYLYPTHSEDVNVAVGAHITQSDPLYGPSGWKNVLASPTGQLTYQGKSYASLYWEGTGDGEYPLLTSGLVVSQKDVISTIQRQMSEQGFNQKEITDFLAYWRPRLPNTPYVRLSWLTTAQMNNLAPLSIYPKPQTVIRAFLDFSGLDHPEKLTPQSFQAPQRKGFTVVEWGGLNR